MPTRLSRHRHYNLVEDTYDTRVPVHNEDAFHHGINFKAKFIGSMDVQRPTARTEIVVAMRNIRYQFKAKQVKKRKVNVSISVDGVRIILRKKKKRHQWNWDEDQTTLMHDPVYRIFYVSHDSHDLKIWSYIARDGNSNRFRCNVFKSNKKRQAMHLVRTIGQAFEVCHKFNAQSSSKNDQKKDEVASKLNICLTENESNEKEIEETDIDAVDIELDGTEVNLNKGVTDLDSATKMNEGGSRPPSHPLSRRRLTLSDDVTLSQCKLQLMHQKVTHAKQEAQVGAAEIKLLKDQLATERSARMEAQARNHQLLVQNRELISEMDELVGKLKELQQLYGDHIVAGKNPSFTKHNTSTASLVIEAPTSLVAQSHSHSSTTYTTANRDVTLPSFSFTSRDGSGSCDESSRFTGSVMQNDHTNKSGSEEVMSTNGVLTACNGPSESSDASLSSSSSSSCSDGSCEMKRTLQRGSNDTDRTVVNDTADTSIWTSGIATPAEVATRTGESLFNDVTSLLSTSTLSANDSNINPSMNGYTLSPILPPKEHKSTTASTKANATNPIVWRPLSPPQDRIKSVGIPRIDPPPRVERSLLPSEHHIKSDTSCSSSVLSSSTGVAGITFQDEDATMHSHPSTSPPTVVERKLFEFIPDNYERSQRYEPLNKFEAANKTRSMLTTSAPSTVQSTFSNNPSLTLPPPHSDDIDTTVGSILDQVATDQFSSDFWEIDVKLSEMGVGPVSGTDSPIFYLDKSTR